MYYDDIWPFLAYKVFNNFSKQVLCELTHFILLRILLNVKLSFSRLKYILQHFFISSMKHSF